MEQKVIDKMNEQINFEMYSGFIYLNTALKMEKLNYKGYSSFLFNHYKEEMKHAEDFINFLVKRDVTPTLMDVKMEEVNVKTPLEAAKLILEHERKVSKKIYELHDIAKENGDYASEIFLHSYINEQIEEEDLAKENLDLFTLADNNISATISVDLTFRK
ncbi:ferritin [Miniphocaeibacter massiliensis]|uniref:ferritin n=1 Tax=Miniphocaeibacter massiliensis TaxID=2041841 RepID=UPI0013EB6E2D|nr:ferritin [Miniphocaeibacter massiliensis]